MKTRRDFASKSNAIPERAAGTQVAPRGADGTALAKVRGSLFDRPDSDFDPADEVEVGEE